jgi:hypothetical protein
VKGIQNCSNESQLSFSRGDNGKKSKNTLTNFKHLLLQISIKLCTNHHWVKGIQNCSNKGPGPLQREDYHKNANIRSYYTITLWLNYQHHTLAYYTITHWLINIALWLITSAHFGL